MRKSALPSSFAIVRRSNLRARAMKTLFLTLLFGAAGYSANAIVVVNPATGGTNICSNLAANGTTPGFTALGPMTVQEGAGGGVNNGDFAAGTNTVSFTAPAGWQFNTGAATTIQFIPGRNITSITNVVLTATTLTFDVNVTGTAQRDGIQVTGLEVQATSTGSSAGSIVASVSAGSMNGLPTSNMGNLSLTAATTPAVTIAVTPSNVVCAGVAVTFTPTPSNAVAPTYSWFVNGNPQGISATFNYMPTNGDNVQAVMTSNGTCETNSTPSSNVINMTVNPLPSIASASGSPNPLCETSQLNLSATPNAGTGPFTYSWTGPGGYAAVGQNPVRNPVTTGGAGVYNVTISDGNGCTAASAFATPAVIVNANPVVSASAVPNPICEEQQLNLTTGIISGSPTSFQWNGPNGYAASGASTNIASVTSLAAGVYTVVATDVNTCSAQATTANVVVRPLPTLSANAVPLDICEGNPLTLTSTPGGGTGGFTSFSWTGPGGYVSSSEDPAPFNVTLANTGSYNVTVTDGAGCTSHVATTLPVTVHANPAIIASGSPNPACVGNTLNLSSTPSGGTLPYTFVWSGPSGFASNVEDPTRGPLTVAHAGTYSVTVTDFWGCVARANTGNIPVNTNPTISAFATPTSICEGATLTLQSVPAGGSGVYPTFSWTSPGGFTSASQNTTNPNITLAGAGVYSVVVTDNNGCSSAPGLTSAVVVHANPTIIANATPNPICEGSTLNLTSTPSGGSGTYVSYAWNGPSFTASTQNTTNPNITLAGLGVYSVTVTDNFGCTATNNTGAVVVFARPTVAAASASPNPICVNQTLNLNMTPAGGSGTYTTYTWSGPAGYTAATQAATRANVTTAHAGIYSVTVTDNNNCVSLPGVTSSVVVNTLPTITANASPNLICEGNTLALTSTPAAGSGSYPTYSWTGPNSFASAGQNPSIPTITTAGTGTYSVFVTDGNGCTSAAPGTVAVTVNTLPTATIGSTLVPPCVGSTLNLTSTPTGGSGVYSSFAWNGPNSFVSVNQNPSIPSVTAAAQGTYTFTVTDNNGCTSLPVTTFVTVNLNPAIGVATATPNPICENQTLNLNASGIGGSGIYTSYSWTGPNGYTAATQAATRPLMTTADAGAYSVTVTDNNGCTSAPGATSAVVVNTLPMITANAAPNPICVGNTLALSSTPAGGSGSYTTYSWTGPNSYVAVGQNPTVPSVTTASAGIYSVLVTDGNGCTSANHGTVTVNVNTLPTATIGSSLVPPCVGSTLNLTATPAGGSGTFTTFAWNGPNSFVSALQNPSIPSVTTAAQGTYTFTVSDNNGCTSLPVTTFVTVNTNPTIGSATATPNPICENQTLNLNAAGAGGSGFYVSYAWTGPNGYTAATQAATRANMTTADAGAYSVTVTDNNGCTSAPGATSAVVVNTLPVITANATPNPLCTGATLALSSTPSGGSSGSYVSYSWSGPNGFTAAIQNPSVPNVVAASAGVYSVNVTDGNGCTSAAPGTTSPVVIWSLPTAAVGATSNPLCESATLTLTTNPGGGSGTYTNFSWVGPNGFTSVAQNPTITPITMAGAGVYSVTVTDNNGCTSLQYTSPLVLVNPNPTITANATPNPICEGLTLSLTSTPSGGNLPYTAFAWSGPSFTAATQNTNRTNIPLAGAGIYSVTVTDVNGCSGTGTVNVTVNSNPTISALATPNPICSGNTLSLTSTPSGGSGTYTTFSWTGPFFYTAGTQNATRTNVNFLHGGVYNVTVTDNNGCVGSGATSSVVVNLNPIVTTATATPNPICEGSTLTLTGGAVSGTTPYASYAWSGPNSYSSTVTTTSTTLPNITTAGAGSYSVTITDVNGCSGSGVTSPVVVNTNPVIASATATPNPICSGATLGLASTATGGSGTYTTYSWAGPGGFSATGQNTTYVGIPVGGAGVYSVNVTDNNGCTSAAPGTTASVVVNASPTIVVNTNSPVCEGNNTLLLNSTPSGGSGTYVSFAWSGPLGFTASTQNTSISPVAPANSGVYNVTVTDDNGCFGSGLSTVTINPLPAVFNVTGGGSYCSGGAGVSIGLDGSESGVDYTLYFGSTIAGSASGTGSAISFGNFTAAGATYSVSATNTLTGCSQGMSGNTSVTILPLPVQYNVTGGGDYCLNGSGVSVGMAMTDVGYTYQLYRGATPVGPAIGGTGGAISFGLQTTVGTYTVLATNDFTSCQNVMNGSAVVNTLPLPADHLVAGGGVGCQSGPGFHVGMTGSDFGIEYQLYNGGTAVGAPVPGNGGGIDFGIFNTSGTYTVLATNSVTGCQAVMSGQADFIINPNPTVFNISGGGGYCIGGPGATIGLTGSETGVDYQLYNGSSPVGLPVSGTGSAITFGPQAAPGTYSVSATNTTTFCMSNMGGSTVVVPNAPPTVYAVSGGGNYCDGGAGVPVILSGSEVGVTYTVTDGSTTVLTGTGTGAAPFTIGNVTAAGTFSVVATNPVTTCTSDMTGDATVAIDPLPTDQPITGGGTRCAADPGLSIDLASSDAGIAYELFLAGVSQGTPINGPGAFTFGTFTAAGTYTVQATNISTGCSTVLSGSAVIVVNPIPSPITGASSVCEGSTISLSDVDAPGIWNVDNASLATINPVTGDLTGITAGTVNVTYTLNTGCFISTAITVNTTPSISGSTNVCAGSAVGLTGTPGGGTWSNSTPSIATIDMMTGVITGVSAGSDEVTYTLGTGCYMTRTQTVDALPVLPAITATATSVCEGATVTYFNSLGGGTWSSSSPANATVDMFTGVVTGVLAGSSNIIYGYTDAFTGCSNTTSQGVTVNPSPGISPITGANNICSAATTTLANASTGGVWSSSNNSIATVDGSTGLVTGVSAGSVNISYTVTNGFGCSASTTYAMTIGNQLPATAILPVGGASICDSNAVNLSVVTSGTLTFYQWVLNGLDILGANTSTYSTMTPGFYQVTIGDGSCRQTLTAGTTVVAGPAPVILFDTVNNLLYTGSFATYQWFFNGALIPGATSSLITPMGDGVYAVVVSDVNLCSDTATFQLGHPVGVNSTSFNKDVRIYPNPATTTLHIDAPGKVFVTVLSADGKMLIERQEAVSINVSQLADGMYMIMVHDENGALIKADKFMKMQ